MSSSFPVRLLSRLVGWLGDVRVAESAPASMYEGTPLPHGIACGCKDCSPGDVQKGERT